jgi:serine/threonine-protein kinase RsbW
VTAAPAIDLTAVCTYSGPARPQALTTFRRLVRNWLTCTVDLNPERESDIVLATDEALSNCVDHAYRDQSATGAMTVKVSYDTSDSVLKVCVTDHGCWIEPDPAALNNVRGRGVMLMNALADTCTLEGHDYGTTVCLHFEDCPAVRDALAYAS